MRERSDKRSFTKPARSVEEFWDETVSMLLDRRRAKDRRVSTPADPELRPVRKPKRG